jgi:hypothetical protein
MISIDLKAKLWFWWPIITWPLALATIVGLIWYFLPDAGNEEFAETGYGSIKELSRYTNFRHAYLAANGGEDKLAALQSMQARGIFTSGGHSVPFHSLKRRPNQSFTTLKFPDYDLSFVVNGDLVWQRVKVAGQEPSYELKEGIEAEGLRQLGEFFDPIMNPLLFDKGSIERLSASTWESQAALRLDFAADSGLQAAAYIDPETMRPLARVESFADGKQRKILYSQYQSIGGMQEPFLIETYMNGELSSRVTLEKSEHNVGTVASIFDYPELISPPQGTETTPHN